MSGGEGEVEVRYYPAVREAGPGRKSRPEPPPLGLLGRLARKGIRIFDEGVRLRVEVPRASLGDPQWSLLERALARHAPYLADQARVIERVRERFEPEALRAALRTFEPPLVELAHDTVDGVKRWQRLLAGPLAGADLDLACAAYATLKAVETVLKGEADVVDLLHPDEEPDGC